MRWLFMSIAASVVLTVLLNLAIRLWPGPARRGEQHLTGWAQRQRGAEFGPEDRRVRVVVPWKAMIVASIGVTILVNVLIRLV